MHPRWQHAVQSLLVVALLLVLVQVGAAAENPMLKRGMQGPEVLALQKLLVELGYDLAADGIFGSETERTVREIQLAAGLDPDGATT
jgi:peptidoglycan hydrolase-like protein with peptidoglycan-binding domain